MQIFVCGIDGTPASLNKTVITFIGEQSVKLGKEAKQ